MAALWSRLCVVLQATHCICLQAQLIAAIHEHTFFLVEQQKQKNQQYW